MEKYQFTFDKVRHEWLRGFKATKEKTAKIDAVNKVVFTNPLSGSHVFVLAQHKNTLTISGSFGHARYKYAKEIRDFAHLSELGFENFEKALFGGPVDKYRFDKSDAIHCMENIFTLPRAEKQNDVTNKQLHLHLLSLIETSHDVEDFGRAMEATEAYAVKDVSWFTSDVIKEIVESSKTLYMKYVVHWVVLQMVAEQLTTQCVTKRG